MPRRSLAEKIVPMLAFFAVVLAMPAVARAAETHSMYRLYNPYTGEHFYTASATERDSLKVVGWRDEGIGWIAPEKSSTPVYRLYNPYVAGGDHHYTTSTAERDALTAQGWRFEGIGWYSDDAKGTPLYRQYNPYAKTGTHNYTANKDENDILVWAGWREEGIGWYGAAHEHNWIDHTATRTVVVITDVVDVPAQTEAWGRLNSAVHPDGSYVGAEYGNHGQYNGLEMPANEIESWMMDCSYEERLIRINYSWTNFTKVIVPAQTHEERTETTETYVDYQYCSLCGQRK